MRAAAACVVLAAAIATPGIVVAATSSSPRPGQFLVGQPSVVSSFAQPVVPMSPAMRRVSDALTANFGAKRIELHFLPTGQATYEAFQSGSGRCLVDIVVSTSSTAPELVFPTSCDSRSTVADGVGITYSPPSVRGTVEQALATLSR